MAPAALGVLPGAPPTPAPPLCSKGSFLKPPPQQQTDLRSEPWLLGLRLVPQTPRMHACPRLYPHGEAPLPTARPPPHLMQAGVPPAQGQIALPPPRGPLSSPVCPPPSCQRTHLSPIPGHQPWVSVPSCPLLAPQHPVLRLPAVTMEGIWYETNKENKNQT